MKRLCAYVCVTTFLSCGGTKTPDAATPIAGGTQAAVGALPAPTATSAAKPTQKRYDALIAKALSEVERTRGLRAKHPIAGETLSRAAMIAQVKDHVLREVPEQAILREGRTLQLLGTVPEEFDYAAETFALLEEQLAGFYSPEDGKMFLAEDLKGDLAAMTLSHELVHALQDHAWDLKSQSKYKPGESDRAFARSALAEGDATSAMLDPMLEKMGLSAADLPEEQVETLMTQATMSKRKVPEIMQHSLIAPYVVGLRFVNRVRKQGGWEAVNEAWASPPLSSEQILHLDKWKAKEAPLPVPNATASALGPGYEVKDIDAMGEEGLSLLYEEWVGHAEAKELAAGWGGDRITFFQRGDEVSLAIRVRTDASKGNALARRVYQSLSKALAKKLGRPASGAKDSICFERPRLGPLTLSQRGDEFVMTAGPTKPGAPAWSSATTCKVAQTWNSEVLSAQEIISHKPAPLESK